MIGIAFVPKGTSGAIATMGRDKAPAVPRPYHLMFQPAQECMRSPVFIGSR